MLNTIHLFIFKELNFHGFANLSKIVKFISTLHNNVFAHGTVTNDNDLR